MGQQQPTAAGDPVRERQVPPLPTRGAGQRERRCDNRHLLNPGDPPLGTAKLGEQAQWKNHTEERAPAHVEDLIARLVDVPREPVD